MGRKGKTTAASQVVKKHVEDAVPPKTTRQLKRTHAGKQSNTLAKKRRLTRRLPAQKTEELETLSDPTAFLKDIEEKCPSIIYVFNTKQAKLLSLNGSEPYEPKEVNQQFLDNCNSWVTMKEMIGHSGENLRQSMVTPWNVNEPISAEEFQQQAEVMKEVAERLEKVIDLRLKATKKKYGEARLPRVVRLCRKYNLSNNEMMIVLYVLTFQYREEQESKKTLFASYRGIDMVHMCIVMNVPFLELLSFLNQDRLHMQQGLFPNIQQSYILSNSLEMDYDMYLALMGADLKQKDFLKIDQTCLADVIFEEPEYQHFREQANEGKLKQSAVTTAKKKAGPSVVPQQLTSTKDQQMEMDPSVVSNELLQGGNMAEDDN